MLKKEETALKASLQGVMNSIRSSDTESMEEYSDVMDSFQKLSQEISNMKEAELASRIASLSSILGNLNTQYLEKAQSVGVDGVIFSKVMDAVTDTASKTSASMLKMIKAAGEDEAVAPSTMDVMRITVLLGKNTEFSGKYAEATLPQMDALVGQIFSSVQKELVNDIGNISDDDILNKMTKSIGQKISDKIFSGLSAKQASLIGLHNKSQNLQERLEKLQSSSTDDIQTYAITQKLEALKVLETKEASLSSANKDNVNHIRKDGIQSDLGTISAEIAVLSEKITQYEAAKANAEGLAKALSGFHAFMITPEESLQTPDYSKGNLDIAHMQQFVAGKLAMLTETQISDEILDLQKLDEIFTERAKLVQNSEIYAAKLDQMRSEMDSLRFIQKDINSLLKAKLDNAAKFLASDVKFDKAIDDIYSMNRQSVMTLQLKITQTAHEYAKVLFELEQNYESLNTVARSINSLLKSVDSKLASEHKDIVDELENASDPVIGHNKMHMNILGELADEIELAQNDIPTVRTANVPSIRINDDEELGEGGRFDASYTPLSFDASRNESGRNSRMSEHAEVLDLSQELGGLYTGALGSAVNHIVSSLQAEMPQASVSLVVEAMKAAAAEAPEALKNLTIEEFTNGVQDLVFTSTTRTRAGVSRDMERSYAMPEDLAERSMFLDDAEISFDGAAADQASSPKVRRDAVYDIGATFQAGGFTEDDAITAGFADDEMVGHVFIKEQPLANVEFVMAPAEASATVAIEEASVTRDVVLSPAPATAVALTAAALADPMARGDTIRALVEAGILAAPEPEAHDMEEVIYAAKSLSHYRAKAALEDSAVDLSDNGPLFSPSKSDLLFDDEGFESHARTSLERASPDTEVKKSEYLASMFGAEVYQALANNVNVKQNPYLSDEHRFDLGSNKQGSQSLYAVHDSTALDLTKPNGHDLMNSYLAALRRHLQANLVVA